MEQLPLLLFSCPLPWGISVDLMECGIYDPEPLLRRSGMVLMADSRSGAFPWQSLQPDLPLTPPIPAAGWHAAPHILVCVVKFLKERKQWSQITALEADPEVPH